MTVVCMTEGCQANYIDYQTKGADGEQLSELIYAAAFN